MTAISLEGRRRVAAVVIGFVFAAGLALPAEANGPVRSGTIVGGWGVVLTGPVGCQIAPDCVAWLAAGCPPSLAGKDPAVFASIVDVRELAGSKRTIRIAEPYSNGWFSATVEFWNRGCDPLSWYGYPERVRDGDRLSVPRGAAFMTVTPSGFAYRWELH